MLGSRDLHEGDFKKLLEKILEKEFPHLSLEGKNKIVTDTIDHFKKSFGEDFTSQLDFTSNIRYENKENFIKSLEVILTAKILNPNKNHENLIQILFNKDLKPEELKEKLKNEIKDNLNENNEKLKIAPQPNMSPLTEAQINQKADELTEHLLKDKDKMKPTLENKEFLDPLRATLINCLGFDPRNPDMPIVQFVMHGNAAGMTFFYPASETSWSFAIRANTANIGEPDELGLEVKRMVEILATGGVREGLLQDIESIIRPSPTLTPNGH